jgi:hypothetical protein
MANRLRCAAIFILIAIGCGRSQNQQPDAPTNPPSSGAKAINDGETKEVMPVSQWYGEIANQTLRAEAPHEGYIINAKDFEKLWVAWRGKEKVPSVDFANQLVIVSTSDVGIIVRFQLLLDTKANLSVMSLQGPFPPNGFSYGIAVLDRKGLKSIGRVALEK